MANRNQQKFSMAAVQRRLTGVTDPRTSSFRVGKPIYRGTSFAARRGGGPGIGRPVGSGDVDKKRSAINRRMRRG